MRAFFAAGGRMIDSSPMYGSSQPVIGYGLKKFGAPNLFSAEKVWTSSGARGPAQIEASRKFWGVPKFDLLQVHNLLAWEEHLRTLFAMKAAGQVRYVGITTSEGRRHAEVEKIMASQPLDFVQVSYNVLDREAENRILPLARDRGIAVIVNRPFREGDLVKTIMRKPLPPFAAEIGATSWAQLILKFIISHPAVTCAIPATTRVDHVQENIAAARDPLPDAAWRAKLVAHVAAFPKACLRSADHDVGVVDLLAQQLPAVLAAHLLSAVRAHQCRCLAAADRHARGRTCDPVSDPFATPRGAAALSRPFSRRSGCSSRGLICCSATIRSTSRRATMRSASRFRRRCSLDRRRP